jgi:hypothetical protein
MSSQQMALVTATLTDATGRAVPLGTFDTRSGGESTSENTKRRSGGMGAQKSYGALPDTGDVTISRVAELERDHEQNRWIRTRVGLGIITISDQPLGDDGAPYGRPTVYKGRLTGFDPGEVDSDSTDARMFELTAQITSVA